MTKVKICGIKDPQSFNTAQEAGADWIGFVFFPPSPRYVTPKQAFEISTASEPRTACVGLFVNPTEVEVRRTLDDVHLDVLQFYGGDSEIARIRTFFHGEIWRAAGVSEPVDLPSETLGADRLVIEAKQPPASDRPGGNAVAFQWAITKSWVSPCPWILAGGLDPTNVSSAIRLSGASAVDVSSGVETAPGTKNPELIRAFIRAAKNSDPPPVRL